MRQQPKTPTPPRPANKVNKVNKENMDNHQNFFQREILENLSPAAAQRRCTSAVQVSAPSVGGQPEREGRHKLEGEKWLKIPIG